MVSSVFRGSEWIITPEKTDRNSGKRPDIVVEKLNREGNEPRLTLLMELKSSKGDRPKVYQAPVLQNLPNDLDLLYHDYTHLRKDTDVRVEAYSYKIPCVFDLDKHEIEIDYLFYHMANHEPRSSLPDQV
jgi:hypothetical protein